MLPGRRWYATDLGSIGRNQPCMRFPHVSYYIIPSMATLLTGLGNPSGVVGKEGRYARPCLIQEGIVRQRAQEQMS
jgi:hypothetical protein